MQNEINITLTPAQLQIIDDALAVLETAALAFPNLSTADKAALVKPPADAGSWMAAMLVRAQQNLNHLPRDFDPALVQNDLNLSAALYPRILRLERVKDRFDHAAFVADSDAFADLLEARRRLLDAEVTGVDDNLNEGMTRLFNRPKRNPAKPTA